MEKLIEFKNVKKAYEVGTTLNPILQIRKTEAQ
jgi:hypothetical protein